MNLHQFFGIFVMIKNRLCADHFRTDHSCPCSWQSKRNGRSLTPAIGAKITGFARLTFPIVSCFILLLFRKHFLLPAFSDSRTHTSAVRSLFSAAVFLVQNPQSIQRQGTVVNVDGICFIGNNPSQSAGRNDLQVCDTGFFLT